MIKYKRILLKLSGEVFGGKQKYGIDLEVLSVIAQEIKSIRQSLDELELKRRQLYHKKNEIEGLKNSILQEKTSYSFKVKEKQEA